VEKLLEATDKTLPVHHVKKTIDTIGGKTEGLKYETLVVDQIACMANCLPYEVAREVEFAPIKNLDGVDSVESARGLLEGCGVAL